MVNEIECSLKIAYYRSLYRSRLPRIKKAVTTTKIYLLDTFPNDLYALMDCRIVTANQEHKVYENILAKNGD